MTILITFDGNGGTKKWFIDTDKLGIFNNILENNIDIINEVIQLKNINHNDFSIIYNLLHEEYIDDNNIEKYDIITLYNLYKITDYLIITDLQEIIGKNIAYRLNKMSIEDLKNNVYNLFYDHEKNIN